MTIAELHKAVTSITNDDSEMSLEDASRFMQDILTELDPNNGRFEDETERKELEDLVIYTAAAHYMRESTK